MSTQTLEFYNFIILWERRLRLRVRGLENFLGTRNPLKVTGVMSHSASYRLRIRMKTLDY